MLSIGDIRKQVEECDIGFRLHVGANFLGLMSQLNGSITSVFLKICIKSHRLSLSWQMFQLFYRPVKFWESGLFLSQSQQRRLNFQACIHTDFLQEDL